MWLNSTAQTALRAMLFLAEQGSETPVRVGDIAEGVGCPQNYLSKTLHILAREGVLLSTRGPKGGFRLAEPPERVSLSRVVAPFAPAGEQRCLVGRPNCGVAPPCRVHHRWSGVAAAVESFFAETTIADLVLLGPEIAAH